MSSSDRTNHDRYVRTDAPPSVDCWCGWYPLALPKIMFATHLAWHLDRLNIRNLIREVLA